MENHTENGNGRTVTHDQAHLPILDDRSLTPRYNPGGTTITLETARDVEVVRYAFQDREHELGKLAKNNEAAGYASAARAQLGDRDLIKTRILPQLGAQLTLPVELEPVEKRIRQAIQLRLERLTRSVLEAAQTHGVDSPAARELQLGAIRAVAADLTDAIRETTHDMHDRAYHAGLSERRNTFGRLFDEVAAPFEGL